jgi:putative endonuclease
MYQERQRTQQSISGGAGRSAGRSARVGRRGEQIAATYLERRGYRVLDRNWRSGDPAQRGELDLILRHRSVLVVCEVKTRTGGHLAHPAEAVTAEKLGRLRRLAGLWLREQAAYAQTARDHSPRLHSAHVHTAHTQPAHTQPAHAQPAHASAKLRRASGLALGLLLPTRRPRPFVPAELRIDVVAVRLGPREPFPVLAVEHLAGVA